MPLVSVEGRSASEVSDSRCRYTQLATSRSRRVFRQGSIRSIWGHTCPHPSTWLMPSASAWVPVSGILLRRQHSWYREHCDSVSDSTCMAFGVLTLTTLHRIGPKNKISYDACQWVSRLKFIPFLHGKFLRCNDISINLSQYEEQEQ